jgi:hypothetical protein
MVMADTVNNRPTGTRMMHLARVAFDSCNHAAEDCGDGALAAQDAICEGLGYVEYSAVLSDSERHGLQRYLGGLYAARAGHDSD